MKEPSDPQQANEELRRKLIGLGEKSLRKSYYPALQERLAELERFRALLEQSTEIILLVDAADMRLVDCNQAACVLLGRSRQQLRGEALTSLTVCSPLSPMAALLNDPATADEGQVSGVCRCPGGDGKQIPMEFTAGRVVFAENRYLVLVGRDISERLRAEHALRESEERYRVLFEHSNDAIFVHDERGRFLDVNINACLMLGHDRQSLLKMRTLDCLPPDDRYLIKEATQELKARGRVHFESRFLRADGSLIDVEITVSRVGGSTSLHQSLVRDITIRKQSERALRDSEERLRLLAENVTDVIWVVELADLSYSYLSPSVHRLLGLTPQEAMRRTLDQTLTPASLNAALSALEEELALEGDPHSDPERTRTMELENLCADGSTVWVEATCRFVRDPQGRPIAIIGVSRDITERRQAREQIRQSEEKYRIILEASPDPIVLYDVEGRVLYLNPAFTRVFGWSLDELRGRTINYVPPEEWPRTKEMLDVMKQGRALFGFETRRYNKRGEILDVALSWSVWRDQREEPAGSIVVLRDTTETNKLQAQLEQARKMEAVGALAGGIAHDLNNVLQAVSGNVQLMLLKAKLDQDSREHLADIDTLLQRASDTIQQLLTMSRKKASRLESMSVNREITHVFRLLQRIIPKMINVELRLAADLRQIKGDPAQMEQIILNLATNAVDAMPDGGRLLLETMNLDLDEMFCRAHPETDPGPHILVRVTDTGKGIDRRTLDHIFEPFFTTKLPGQGTGLGLSTVYSIVKAHRGLISCYSMPGQGTVFKIYLPAQEEPALESGAGRPPGNDLRGGEETILVVDDEEAILRTGCEILEIFGYHVLRASDGEEALSICRALPGGVDLVILDLNMPGMGGLRCLESLLKLSPPVKVVISSGYTTDSISQDLRSAGAASFINKPYRLNDMVARVREILDSGPAAGLS